MSENKFIRRLKGESTAKSVLEIKNQSVNTSFANMPHGTSDANRVYADHSGDAVGVLQGAENWKLNGSALVYASSINSDGNDYTGETDKTGGSVVLDGDGMAVSGAGLWVDATYTFTGDPTKTVAIFNAGTKWVLKLCGHSLFSDNKTIDLTVLIKIGASSVISKVFTVTTDSFNFCKDLVIDFVESTQTVTKVQGNETLKLQVLCSDTTASATLYNGMTVLTSLQRRVDADIVSSDKYNLDEVLDNKADVDLDNLSTTGKANISALGTYNESNTYNAGTVGKALQDKLNLDGTNTMTGVLKMRASASFQCAIAPYWDGVGFYKLNDNDSVTLMASMESTEGFSPFSTNTYDIGTSSHKWKNLYLAGKAFIGTINNGYDIAVPVTSGPDTLALKSEVDTAANSGRMITDQGVWFAKMYAATVPPAADDGTNYADFSQTDGDGNPIIVIYERQSGAWVQTQTVTPPANYDGYVPVTKKIWDIVEQTGQNGGRILWNHQSKEFTPYPSVVSFEDIEITGDSTVDMPASPGTQQIVNKNYVDSQIAASAATKANVDMDNLTSTGKNIGLWCNNAANIITEIPQDINIELSSGSLIVKAGTKAYMPDGTTVTVASDITVTASSTTTRFLFLNSAGTGVDYINVDLCYSGATAPTVSGTARWFDTANNVFKQTTDSGSTWTTLSETLPIAIFHTTSGSIDKVEVFNCFGYIGSTIFALPGVKILIPQGRNADGTLKNKAHTVPSIRYYTSTGGTYTNLAFMVAETGLSTYTVAYNPETNYVYRTDTGATYTDRIIAGNVNIESGRITYFKTKQPFHALDYSDTEYMAHQAMPSSRYVNLTLGASGTEYTAPGDGYFVLNKSHGANTNLEILTMQNYAKPTTGTQWVDGLIVRNFANTTGISSGIFVPAKKGDKVMVLYSFSGNTNAFRFYYAQGES